MSRVSASVALALGVGLAGCSGQVEVSDGPPPCVPSSGTPRPIAHVGPDVTLKVPCGGGAMGPIASISAVEGGPFDWWARVDGPPGVFEVPDLTRRTCAGDPVSIVNVSMRMPASAAPGDAFDGLVSVMMSGTATPLGTAMVHGTSLDLAATVTPTVLDFGDVLPGTTAGRELRFDTSVTQSPLVAWTNRFSPPFTVDMNVLHLRAGNPAVMRVLATGAIPGDYLYDLVWTVQGEPTDPPLPCALTLVVKLHARILEPATPATSGGR